MFRRKFASIIAALMLGSLAGQTAASPDEADKKNAMLAARATPKNATPLSMEIGYANIMGVRAPSHD